MVRKRSTAASAASASANHSAAAPQSRRSPPLSAQRLRSLSRSIPASSREFISDAVSTVASASSPCIPSASKPSTAGEKKRYRAQVDNLTLNISHIRDRMRLHLRTVDVFDQVDTASVQVKKRQRTSAHTANPTPTSPPHRSDTTLNLRIKRERSLPREEHAGNDRPHTHSHPRSRRGSASATPAPAPAPAPAASASRAQRKKSADKDTDREDPVLNARTLITRMQTYLATNPKLELTGRNRKSALSLSVIPACEAYGSIDFLQYIIALCEVHAASIRRALEDSADMSVVLPDSSQNVFHTAKQDEMAAASWHNRFRSTKSTRSKHNLIPPFLERTADVVLLLRMYTDGIGLETSLGKTTLLLSTWYSTEKASAVLLEFAYAVAHMWRYSADMSGEDKPDPGPTLSLTLRALTSIFTFEADPFATRAFKLQQSQRANTLIAAIIKSGADSFASFMDIFIDVSEVPEVRACLSHVMMNHVLSICTPSALPHLGKVWSSYIPVARKALSAIYESPLYWNLVLSSIKTLMKLSFSNGTASGKRMRMSTGTIGSLLSESIPSRGLLDTHTKTRHSLLEVLIYHMKMFARSPQEFMSAAVENKENYPTVFTVIDIIRKMMVSAAVQRELVSATEQSFRDNYLSAVEELLMSCAKLTKIEKIKDPLVVAKAADITAKMTTEEKDKAKNEDVIIIDAVEGNGEEEDDDITSDAGEEERNRLRVIAFAVTIAGSLGKSMEDGSRNMAQMNSLRALFEFRFNNVRNLGRLYDALYRLQRSADRYLKIPSDDGKESTKETLLTPTERDWFSMVVERVRAELVAEHNKNRGGNGNSAAASFSKLPTVGQDGTTENGNKPLAARPSRIAFGSVTKVNLFRAAVASKLGHLFFDDDVHVKACVSEKYRDDANQIVARYDSDNSELVSRWTRLRSNVYIGNAKDLLEPSDKVLPCKCQCLPGNVHDNRSNSGSLIGCSNGSCVNRAIKVECDPSTCPAGSFCQNQRMQRLEYAKVKTENLGGKGIGIVADENIPAGTLIGEYQGEVVTIDEFDERKKRYEGERHFYFMTLTSKLVIDASRKSQMTRFVNHSCEPNAEAHKWNVLGEPRVGIFAKRDIRRSEEITFDYGARSLGSNNTVCLCKAPSCRGFLTVREETIDGDDHKSPGDAKEVTPMKDATKGSQKWEADRQAWVKPKNMDVDNWLEVAQQKTKEAEKLEALVATKLNETSVPETPIDEKAKARLQKWESEVKLAEEERGSRLFFDSSDLRPSGYRIPRKAESKAEPSSSEKPARSPSKEKGSSKTDENKQKSGSTPKEGEHEKRQTPGTAKKSSGTASDSRSRTLLRPDQPIPRISREAAESASKGGDSLSLRPQGTFRGMSSRVDPPADKRPSSSLGKRTSVPREASVEETVQPSREIKAGFYRRPAPPPKPDPYRRIGERHDMYRSAMSKSRSNIVQTIKPDGPKPAPWKPRTLGFMPRGSDVNLSPLRKPSGEESDSSNFSVVSPDIPYIDSPPVSPYPLNSGSGACSDDEFVEAPPVEEEVAAGGPARVIRSPDSPEVTQHMLDKWREQEVYSEARRKVPRDTEGRHHYYDKHRRPIVDHARSSLHPPMPGSDHRYAPELPQYERKLSSQTHRAPNTVDTGKRPDVGAAHHQVVEASGKASRSNLAPVPGSAERNEEKRQQMVSESSDPHGVSRTGEIKRGDSSRVAIDETRSPRRNVLNRIGSRDEVRKEMLGRPEHVVTDHRRLGHQDRSWSRERPPNAPAIQDRLGYGRQEEHRSSVDYGHHQATESARRQSYPRDVDRGMREPQVREGRNGPLSESRSGPSNVRRFDGADAGRDPDPNLSFGSRQQPDINGNRPMPSGFDRGQYDRGESPSKRPKLSSHSSYPEWRGDSRLPPPVPGHPHRSSSHGSHGGKHRRRSQSHRSEPFPRRHQGHSRHSMPREDVRGRNDSNAQRANQGNAHRY